MMDNNELEVEFTKLEMRLNSVENNFSEIKDLQQQTLKEITGLQTSLLERVNDSQNSFTSLKERHNALEDRVRKTERDVDRVELNVQKTQISVAKLAVIGGGSGALIATAFKLMEMLMN